MANIFLRIARFLKKWVIPDILFYKKNVKNVLPVSGAGIQTHNLLNMSLLP